MVYRQYLENVRMSIRNFSLPELKSKEFIEIAKRVNQFEDLSYIDFILKNAGLNLSFISNRDFLNQKVVLKSKLDNIFVNKIDVDDTMKNALSDYMTMFISDEDEILDSISEVSKQISEVSLDYFPQSSTSYCSPEELLEKNKETLSALFGALDNYAEEENKKEVEKENDKAEEQNLNIVEEYFEEDINDTEDIDETNDKETEKSNDRILFDIGNLDKREDSLNEEIENRVEDTEDESNNNKIEIEEKNEELEIEDKDIEQLEDNKSNISENINDSESDDEEDIEQPQQDEDSIPDNIRDFDNIQVNEIEEEIEDNKNKNYHLDTSFLTDTDEDENDEQENIIDNSKEELNNSDNVDSDEDNDEDNDDFSDYESYNYLKDKDFNNFLDDDRDLTGQVLSEELEDEDDILRDTDPVEPRSFKEATDYFLLGRDNKNTNEFKELYKTKEKLVKSPLATNSDDAMAKAVLAVTDSLVSLPKLTRGLFKRFKKGSQRMKENFIVEEENMEDE